MTAATSPRLMEDALAGPVGLARLRRGRGEQGGGGGLLRGRGIGQYLEVTGAPGAEMGGVRFERDGTVTMITGTLE